MILCLSMYVIRELLMLFKVYSVWDSCINAYLQPLFFLTKGQAIRSLTEEVNKPDSDFCKYSDQYVLFELGTFENTDGKFELYSAPISVGVCTEFKNIVSDKPERPN